MDSHKTRQELLPEPMMVKMHDDIKHLYVVPKPQCVNTLRPWQNWCHFTEDIFKCIFLNIYAWIYLKISLKFVPNARIKNDPALVQIMAWHQLGNRQLSEPMLVSLAMLIYITWPPYVKVLTFWLAQDMLYQFMTCFNISLVILITSTHWWNNACKRLIAPRKCLLEKKLKCWECIVANLLHCYWYDMHWNSTVTSHGCCGISNHCPLDLLFNILFKILSKKTSKLCHQIPSQRTIMWKMFPCHDINMSCDLTHTLLIICGCLRYNSPQQYSQLYLSFDQWIDLFFG